MRVRWTTTAADDLANIVEYIRKDNPAAARRVIFLPVLLRCAHFPIEAGAVLLRTPEKLSSFLGPTLLYIKSSTIKRK